MHSDPYAEALLLILRLEGGWWPGAKSDPNPTMHGITQRTYDAYRKAQTLPPRSVRWIEPDEEAAIYRTYWTGAGCQHLDWPVCVVHFDCAVNSGPGNAKILGRRANYDWRRYLAVRQAFYDAIIARHPEKAPNGPGWRRRLARIKTFIEEHP